MSNICVLVKYDMKSKKNIFFLKSFELNKSGIEF